MPDTETQRPDQPLPAVPTQNPIPVAAPADQSIDGVKPAIPATEDVEAPQHTESASDVATQNQPESPAPKAPEPERTRKAANTGPSEAELEAWNAKVAAYKQEKETEQAAKEANRRKAAERRAQQAANAAHWQFIRDAVEKAAKQDEDEPVDEAYLQDELAQRVHKAPSKLRKVIEAVLKANKL